MPIFVKAARLWDGQQIVDRPLVRIEDGLITSVSTELSQAHASDVLDFPAATLAPAFFDVHIHGAAGHDVMEATPEALRAVGSFLATRGCRAYLATTVTAPLDATLRAVAGLAKLIEKPPLTSLDEPLARPLGIHLEGPFLSHEKCGVQPVEHMLKPDVATFDRIYEAAEGKVRLMTVAPELPGADALITHATTRGVRVSLGHSNATAAQTQAAIAAGAVSATHTFNAMRALDHREPGILGTVLTRDDLFAELICDGIHVAPEMVRLWYRMKGSQRGILVTDAMSAAGMPDGEYQLGGFRVQVTNGRAMARGVLAGSVLTLDRALANFMQFTSAELEDTLPLLTVNPAMMTGLEEGANRIVAGQPANFVALDDAGQLLASIINGRVAARN